MTSTTLRRSIPVIGLLVFVAAAGPVPASIRVEEFEGLPTHDQWPEVLPAAPARTWTEEAFAFFRLPQKYNDQGVRDDRDVPTLIRASARIALTPGLQKLLLRSRGGARLFIDGVEVVRTPFLKPSSDGHDPVEPLPDPPAPGARLCAFGDSEVLADWTSDGEPHEWKFEMLVGGKKYRPDPGESCVAFADSPVFRLVTPDRRNVPLTDDGWMAWVEERSPYYDVLDTRNRRTAGAPWWASFRDSRPAPATRLAWTPVTSIDDLLERHPPQSERMPAGRQILARHCGRCHGDKERGDLRLDRRDHALRGGESAKPAIAPGNPPASEVIRRLRDSGDDRMPPQGRRPSADEIATVEKWIEAGAPWDAPAPAAPVAAPAPRPPTDDFAFLRRVWLDTLGVPPDAATVRQFAADTAPDKRTRMIDRLLDDPRWADHWTGYWQDVLAENPGILKPSQSNTGPFRFWIYESMLDNKPMDQFVTELVMMRGSQLGGGPRGFGMSADNDVPAAEKVHVLGSAFLGMQMKCARCHDAPFHSVTQRDLFSIAAMIEGRPLDVPRTSRVPDSFFENRERASLIKVSIKPKERIGPRWPFNGEADGDGSDAGAAQKPVSAALCGPPPASLTRAELARAIVSDGRFAPVLVNRLWARYFGAGIVEPVDDWEGNPASHPELLAWLSAGFARDGYDWKALARKILNSAAYQRVPIAGDASPDYSARRFAAPRQRRLTAEQVVDSLFEVTGQRMGLEELTFDPDARRPPDQMITLGTPTRAWMFCSLANERDRPALALPRAQAVSDVLCAFGWRQARPEPLTVRDDSPNALQPGILANGIMSDWICRATDRSELVRLAIAAPNPASLTESLFLQVLGRPPRPDESRQVTAVLADGFGARLVPPEQQSHLPPPRQLRRVSWSNHLHPDATTVKLEAEKLARAGPAPTPRLEAAWRNRLEDTAWALINAPEFVWVP